MGRGAKNHRFRPAEEISRQTRSPDPAERRGARDRRDPRGADRHDGVERRRGPRRATDLGVPIWRSPLALIVAVGLGIGASLALGSQMPAPSEPHSVRKQVDDARPVDPAALAGVQALRDEARALTAAQVDLDEATHERWMPRVAMIDAALDDPATPEPIRRELESTIAALECVGVLTPSAARTCATIGPQ